MVVIDDNASTSGYIQFSFTLTLFFFYTYHISPSLLLSEHSNDLLLDKLFQPQ